MKSSRKHLTHAEFFISAGELAGLLEETRPASSAGAGKAGILLLDARDPEEYRAGHLPGAVNLPPARLETHRTLPSGAVVEYLVQPDGTIKAGFRQAGIRGEQRLIIYDAGGSSSAARLWWMLDYYGHPQLTLLDGGIAAWTARGGSLITAPTEIKPGDFEPAAQHRKMADFTYVRRHLGDDSTVICNALDAEEHARGAIPGTGNLPYSETFASTGPPLLRPPAELGQLMAELTPDTEKELIFYCGAGYTAAHNYVVARTLGYRRVRLYDGSLTDWIARQAPLSPGTRAGREVVDSKE